MTNKKFKWLLWVVLLGLLAIYPQVFGEYYISWFVTFAVLSVFAVAVNMLLGFTGLLSFGHAIFFGFGGYGTALALKHIEGISLLSAIGIGCLAASALALILTPLITRVTGTAFAMLHMAFGQLVYTTALKLRHVTGGEDGIGNFPIPDLNILGLISIPIQGSPKNLFYLAIILLGVGLWMMWFFIKTPFGQIQVGIRDNAKRIDFLGYRVPHSKGIIYIASGLFSGLAGAVYVLFHNFVCPDGSFGMLVSFGPIIGVMIGGLGTFSGPIWGTAIGQILEETASRYTDRVELVMGVILIVVIMFAPRGFMGLIKALKMKWQIYTAAKSRKEALS